MDKMDYTFLSRVISKRVTVTLTYGKLQGTLIHVDHGRAIMLSKVKDLATNIVKPGIHLCLAPDILNVELQMDNKVCPTMELEEQPPKGERDNEASLQKVKEAPAVEGREAVSPSNIMEAIATAVSKLEIKHIQCQSVIGVASTGSNLCRHGSLYSLQVSTKIHVYLFDIALLGPNIFKCGLKAVLEDKSIVKVVHDCRRLSDCLFHQYGIVLNNVFDTQVADVYLFHTATGGFLPKRANSLEDCLTKHLNMDPCKILFLSKTHDIVKDNLLWSLHPLPLPLQKALALEASYVLSLHTPMAKAMMADFTSIVEGYLEVYAYHEVPNWLEVSGTKLPQQFGLLKDLQRRRKEMALKYYDVDEYGLLAKSGNNLYSFGKDQDLDEKIQASQDLQCSTIDIERDKWSAGVKSVNGFKSEGLEIVPCETRVIGKSPYEYPVWSTAQNPNSSQFPRPQITSQPLVRFSPCAPTTCSHMRFSPRAPTTGSRIRMSAMWFMAETKNAWSS
ncbi:piRNA biogenesis protein EXD1-like isoform X2 [Hyla sarda]|uniref:piRNA biogenesis protein EXD1-like isoform X2 n=1 Tax=Hyla sarda TaxID=327740 RepID=UPI0024C423B3|nr:piRNA biogenesis protein EXD1-like isoform X2 [Hyla sarda]